MNTRPHDPFSPHVVPLPVFVAPDQSAARRDAALKQLAIEQHAAAPAAKPKPPGRPKGSRRAKPTKAQVDDAVAKLEKPR